MKITEQQKAVLEYAQRDLNQLVIKLEAFKKAEPNATAGNTCSHLILPFLRIFGWKETGPNLWSSQHRINNTNKHVDYAFSRNNGWVYVETKKIKFKNIDQNKSFIKQISSYFNAAPGAHLIILTNGEEYCFYSYGENMELSTTPFIRFNVHDLDLTGKGSFMRYFFRNYFNIGDWPRFADMSRSIFEIQHVLQNAPDSISKQNLIKKNFELLYPNLSPEECEEALKFFTTYH